MNIDKTLVRKRFDRSAEHYDRYADVQRRMANTLMEQLPVRMDDNPILSILEIGCGTGYLTLMLAERYPNSNITAVDLSPAMIERCRNRLSSRANITFRAEDAETLVRRMADERFERFDLIVSNATFQWFNDPAGTTTACLNLLNPAGFFVFSTFLERTFHEMKEAFNEAERELGKPHAVRGQSFYTSSSWQRLLRESGLRHLWLEESLREPFPDVRSFLHSVKRLGAGNASNDASSAPYAGKAVFDAMERYYRTHYALSDGIVATYHIGYGMGCI